MRLTEMLPSRRWFFLSCSGLHTRSLSRTYVHWSRAFTPSRWGHHFGAKTAHRLSGWDEDIGVEGDDFGAP